MPNPRKTYNEPRNIPAIIRNKKLLKEKKDEEKE